MPRPSFIAAPSPNHDPRPDRTPTDMLVVHYTGMVSGAAALGRLCDPASKVSAHYLVETDGRIFQLVDEDRRAWHAGVAYWRGHRDINGRSVGIELVNPGHDFGYTDFPAPQIEALIELSHEIQGRHAVPARNVVGHADVAPARKRDPGERFPWARLAAAGIGLWPVNTAPVLEFDAADPAALLAVFGYDTPAESLSTTVKAFQRHFRPTKIDGTPDAETIGILAALLKLVD